MTETTDADLEVTQILAADRREMLELLGQIGATADEDKRRDIADTVIAGGCATQWRSK